MCSAPSHPVGASVAAADLDLDLHATLSRLRSTEPVSWLPVVGGWLVTSYDVSLRVMRDPDGFTVDDPRFSTGRVVGASMLSRDGEEHRRHRSPFVAPFRPARVQERFGAEVTELAHGLVDRFVADGEVDLRPALAGPLSVAVVARTLGLQDVAPATVLGWYDAIVDAVATMHDDAEVPPRAHRAMVALARHVEASAVAGGGDSLLAGAARTLSAPELVGNAAVMMFGGIETTEAMILNVVLHLLEAPVALAALREGRIGIEAVVEESLRLEPAAAVVDRYATRDVELAGARVARGDLVRVSLAGANRDPARFDSPDVFDPERTGVRSQLSFARGPHVCVAMDLARLEARTAVAVLLERLPGLRLVDPARPRGSVFRKPERVRVHWDVASPQEGSHETWPASRA